MTPELALVLGNLFAYSFRLKRKIFLTLQSKREIASDTWEFSFTKPTGLTFHAGQYAEWMLPHTKPDSRGIRRYFTIASSPTEVEVRLACKVIPPDAPQTGSTFKQALSALDNNTEVTLSQVAGDFLLPKASNKVAMIAGGIGITPFISQLTWIRDNSKAVDVTLYYCINTAEEMAYRNELSALSEKMDLKIVPVVAKENGYVTEALLAQHTPDFKYRMWYLSGSPAMVNSYKDLLRDAGVSRSQIKTDYFPGLA